MKKPNLILIVTMWLVLGTAAIAQGPGLGGDVIFPEGADSQNVDCPYMIGNVAIAVIFPESADGIEDWTPEEQTLMVTEVDAALTWWTARAGESGASTIWISETHTLPTMYEPIERPHGDYQLWIPDLLQGTGNWWEQSKAYAGELRDRHGADWGFIVFVVDSSKDADGRFADGWFAFARLGGPFMVMTYDNFFFGPDQAHRVAAHEIGHLFGALDQYIGAQQYCTYTSGYLEIENQNSDYGDCFLSEPSIMKYSNVPVWDGGIVDHYARGQLGWRDSDCDGVLDPLDLVNDRLCRYTYVPAIVLDYTIDYTDVITVEWR